MILEHALLHIKPGQSAAFEAAMRQARPLIAASPGFISIEVRPAAETTDLSADRPLERHRGAS